MREELVIEAEAAPVEELNDRTDIAKQVAEVMFNNVMAVLETCEIEPEPHLDKLGSVMATSINEMKVVYRLAATYMAEDITLMVEEPFIERDGMVRALLIELHEKVGGLDDPDTGQLFEDIFETLACEAE